MCNNKKLLMYQLQIKKKANFCKQNGLPPIRQKGKKHDKNHKIYSHKKGIRLVRVCVTKYNGCEKNMIIEC